jgi:cobyrinic acid a,c-diamide synthase
MAGLLPLETSFENPRLHLGYRALRLLDDGPLGVAGGRYRGHEFHYASIVSEPAGEALFHASNAVDEDLGAVGQRSGGVIGSFLHLIDRVN